MKIKIQKTDEAICLLEKIQQAETEELLKRDFAKVDKNFFDLAQRFFECFPKFREVVFNTEITEEL